MFVTVGFKNFNFYTFSNDLLAVGQKCLNNAPTRTCQRPVYKMCSGDKEITFRMFNNIALEPVDQLF